MAEIKRTGAEEPAGNPGLAPLSILRTIWKRKIRIGLAWIFLACCAVAGVRFLPTVYQAESLVLIDSQKIPEKFVSATVASDLEDRIASIRQTLLSSGELKKIIDDFGLYQKERRTHFEEEILEMMRKDITITLEPVGSGMSAEGGGNINSSMREATAMVAFRIGYQGSNPEMVARVANRLTDLYVAQNAETRESEAAGTSEFLKTQLVEAKQRLDKLEADVSAYKLQHNGELPQQEQALASALSRLQTELEANRDAINRAQQIRVIMEGNLNAMQATLDSETRAWQQSQSPVPDGTVIPGGDLAGGQVSPENQKKTSQALEDELELLRGRYSDTYPDVIRLKADIEKVKRIEADRQAEKVEAATAGAKSGKSGPQSAASPREPVELGRQRQQIAALRVQIEAADKELEERKAQQQQILHDIDTGQKRVERLPVREQEMAQLTRDYEMSKENYKGLLDKQMAADEALDMERRQQSERFTVLDWAQTPRKPIKPKRPELYAGGGVLSLALALVFGFVAELRKNVLLGEWELPAGTPILARLPYIEVQAPVPAGKTASRRRWFRRRKKLAEAASTPAVLALAARLSSLFHRF